ncbi:MAG: hypothetical protein MJE77_22710 [Proteobacteria bacterium]|nr:hypothetical protein [Pseudomonadota bacterium]
MTRIAFNQIAGIRDARGKWCLIVALLAISLAPATASARSEKDIGRVRIAVPEARGKNSTRRTELTLGVRQKLRKAGVSLVSSRKFARAQSAVRASKPRPVVLAKAGRKGGADYVLDVEISSRTQLREGDGGIYTVSVHVARAMLIDTKSEKVELRFQSKYRRASDARDIGVRIAEKALDKLAELTRPRVARESRDEEEDEFTAEKAEGDRESRREKKRRRRREFRREVRASAERSSEAREGGESRLEFAGGEVEGELSERGEREEEGLPLSAEVGLHMFGGDMEASAVRLEPELELNQALALYADASVFSKVQDPLHEGVDDVALGIRAEEFLSGVEARVAIEFPTSEEARAVQNIFTLVAGAGVEFGEGPWKYAVEILGKKFFPTIPQAALEGDEGGEGGAMESEPEFCSTSIQTICPFLGELPPNYLLGAETEVEYEFDSIEGLSAAVKVGYEFVKFFENEHTLEAGFKFDYEITRRWQATVGMLTMGPLKSEEGGFVFPFSDVETDNRSHTTFYAGLSFSLGSSEEEGGE